MDEPGSSSATATSASLDVLSDSLPQLLCTATPEGRVDYVNARWPEYTGRSREALLGTGWLESVHPDDAGAARGALEQACASGEGVRLQYRLRRHDGAWRWFQKQATPVRDPAGARGGNVASR